MSILAAPVVQKAEDAAHSSGDRGTVALGVRRDTPTSLAGADNDYLPITFDSSGRAWVNALAAMTIHYARATFGAGGTYANGDTIGAINTMTGAVRLSAGHAIIKSIIVQECGATLQNAPIDFIFFDSDPVLSTFADKDPAQLGNSDSQRVVAIVSVEAADYTVFGTDVSVAEVNPNKVIKAASGTDCYMAAVVRGTPTYIGSNALGVTIHLEQY